MAFLQLGWGVGGAGCCVVYLEEGFGDWGWGREGRGEWGGGEGGGWGWG